MSTAIHNLEHPQTVEAASNVFCTLSQHLAGETEERFGVTLLSHFPQLGPVQPVTEVS